ncbi:hypothetical protein T484DRAFT_1760319, partial [Baffinella frigidus]
VSRVSAPKQLESLSRALAESKGTQMEVPGQYLNIKEPMPEQHVKVGKMYYFLVEATGAAISSSDERTLQLCQLMNRCMDRF